MDHNAAMPLREPLVTAAELGDLEGATLLDVRWQLGGPPGEVEYQRGHLPGAVYVDLETELAGPAGPGGRHPLPDAARFAEAMRRHGVDADRPVVVYDDAFGRSAARAWWLLRYFGHGEVYLLDGGYAWWVRNGGDVETGPVDVPPGRFTAEPGHLPVVDAAGAARVAGVGVLIDARARERFAGESEPVDPVAGHIPGAVNVPTDRNLIAPRAGLHGQFLMPDDLGIVYAAAGVTRDGEVAVYCGSGVTAAHDVLALATLGIDAALYPGSWSEWVTDPQRPVATGRS